MCVPFVVFGHQVREEKNPLVYFGQFCGSVCPIVNLMPDAKCAKVVLYTSLTNDGVVLRLGHLDSIIVDHYLWRHIVQIVSVSLFIQ